jgi:hypothetical protein
MSAREMRTGIRAGLATTCLLLAACANGTDKTDLGTVASSNTDPAPADAPQIIEPMSQAAVDAALAAPELSAAITAHAEHQPMVMVAAIRKAADAGNPIAQLQMAQLYHRGNILPQDETLALEWLRKSAEQGLGEAEVTLAEGYFAGQGQAQDPAEGWRWLRIAEAQERPAVWTMIGEVYLAGVTPVAASQPQSISDVIDATTRSPDSVEALAYFRRAAAAGDENGATALCLFYMQGQGGRQPSPRDGQPWCDTAVARGSLAARPYASKPFSPPLEQPSRFNQVMASVLDGAATTAYIVLYLAFLFAASGGFYHI